MNTRKQIFGSFIALAFVLNLDAHQVFGDHAHAYTTVVKTSSFLVTFTYSSPGKNKFTLRAVSIAQDDLKIDIPKEELVGIPQINPKRVSVFSEKDDQGKYTYVHAVFQDHDPDLYGPSQGGHRYVRLFFRNGKYTHRKILNGQQKNADGSKFIEYLTKYKGKNSTSSYK